MTEIKRRGNTTIIYEPEMGHPSSSGISFGTASGGTEYAEFDGEGLRVVSQNYLDAVAEGDITGHTVWSKIGFRSASTSGVEVTIAPFLSTTDYIWPATPQHMHVLSSSTNDAAAGTGARTITLYYLDGSYVEKSEVVTMNGTNVVETVASDIFRIQNIRVRTVGSLNATAGAISIQNHAGTTTHGYISAGRTRARQAFWTIPAGKTLYVTELAFSASNMSTAKYARFITKATYDDKLNAVLAPGFFMPFNEVGLLNSSYVRRLEPATRIPATTDLKVTCETNDTATYITCALRGWVE